MIPQLHIPHIKLHTRRLPLHALHLPCHNIIQTLLNLKPQRPVEDPRDTTRPIIRIPRFPALDLQILERAVFVCGDGGPEPPLECAIAVGPEGFETSGDVDSFAAGVHVGGVAFEDVLDEAFCFGWGEDGEAAGEFGCGMLEGCGACE